MCNNVSEDFTFSQSFILTSKISQNPSCISVRVFAQSHSLKLLLLLHFSIFQPEILNLASQLNLAAIL